MKKIILTILLLVMAGCSADLPLGAESFEQKKEKYDEKLRIKAQSKDNVLYAKLTDICVKQKDFDCEQSIKAVSYVYKSENIAPTEVRYLENGKLVKEIKNNTKEDLLSEKLFGASIDPIIENTDKRTYNSITFDLEDNRHITDIYSGAAFYYDDPDWYYIEYATSTLEAYNDQMDAKFATSSDLGWTEWRNIGSKKNWVYGHLIKPVYADSENLTADYDGHCYKADGNWTSAREGSSANNCYPTQPNGLANTGIGKASDGRYTIYRLYTLFDISEYSGDIDSASLFLYNYDSVYQADMGYNYMVLTNHYQASSNITTSDWPNFVDNELSDTHLEFNGTIDGYEEIIFNSNGLDYLNSTSTAKVVLRPAEDYEDEEPICSNGENNYENYYQTERTGTSEDPYLEITYSTGGGEAVTTVRESVWFY